MVVFVIIGNGFNFFPRLIIRFVEYNSFESVTLLCCVSLLFKSYMISFYSIHLAIEIKFHIESMVLDHPKCFGYLHKEILSYGRIIGFVVSFVFSTL